MTVETLPSIGLDPIATSIRTDSATTIALAVFLGQVVAFALACWIGWRTYDGYRDAEGARPALYWLAIGIVLLAAAPIAIRFLLPTLFSAASVTTTLLATSSEIAGLAAILYAVYGRP